MVIRMIRQEIEEYLNEKWGSHPEVHLSLPSNKVQLLVFKYFWKALFLIVCIGLLAYPVGILTGMSILTNIMGHVCVVSLSIWGLVFWVAIDANTYSISIKDSKIGKGSWALKLIAENGIPMSFVLARINRKIEKQIKRNRRAEENVQRALHDLRDQRLNMLAGKLQAMEVDMLRVQKELESLGIKDFN